MKRIAWLVPAAVACVMVFLVTARLVRSSRADAYRLERESLRREMIERSTVARASAGSPGVEEARAVLRWWSDASARLRKEFPAAAIASAPHGRKVRDEEAWYRYAADRVDMIHSAYAPVLSGVDQGIRLDILAIAPGDNPETHERGVRIDFAVWGAPRRVERESTSGEEASAPQRRVVVPLSFRQLGVRLVDGTGKTYGEMIGTGEPYLVLKDPERFHEELPPGVVFGTWWIDPLPREAARMELTVGVQVDGMSSAVLSPSFRWDVPVVDEWRLRPGETFRAETRTAPQESNAGQR